MCLIALAWQIVPGWPLLLAANRDELHERPSAPLDRWEDAPHILGGRDLRGGGTWLGVSEAGRFAAVTNVREPRAPVPGLKSRGELARRILQGEDIPPLEELPHFGACNLLSLIDGQMRYHSNRPQATMQMLPPGIYGLSNGRLDAPWPKTLKLKASISAWAEAAATADSTYFDHLFTLLADTHTPPDQALPDTGVGIERERRLSPVFIAGPDYGTRASTLLMLGTGTRSVITERRYGANGQYLNQSIQYFDWQH